ncbi:hypothetical protein HHI36_003776 [Cryptolaemus montrouzieri]|uniref:Uncharacterized protein n=1 Tax=Cryptolaemus montrouzieri TaxID=559131 RepID=A0ABD2NPK7_9CUCU
MIREYTYGNDNRINETENKSEAENTIIKLEKERETLFEEIQNLTRENAALKTLVQEGSDEKYSTLARENEKLKQENADLTDELSEISDRLDKEQRRALNLKQEFI